MRRIYAGGKGPPYPGSRRGVGKERRGAGKIPSSSSGQPRRVIYERSSRERDAMHVILAAAPGGQGAGAANETAYICTRATLSGLGSVEAFGSREPDDRGLCETSAMTLMSRNSLY